MGELISILSGVSTLIRAAPLELTVAISIFVAILTIWMKSRDIDIGAITNISNLQFSQIKELINQNKELMRHNTQLSRDLQDLREKMTETYNVMESMRVQIMKLEDSIRMYRDKYEVYGNDPD